MNALCARPLRRARYFIPIILMALIASPAMAELRAPDAVNGLAIKPNPTAEVTGVCDRLAERQYSVAIHASCYSQINKAVVVLVSGNAASISGQRIAEIITDEFSNRHIPAVGYQEFPERDKVAITFILNGVPYGAYSGENWQEGFALVARHAPEAWFGLSR